MPYQTNHILVSFGGPLFAGAEEWSSTFRLAGVNAERAGDQVRDQGECDDYADIVKTWFEFGAGINGAAKLGWLKYNRVGADGLYREPYTNLTDYNPDVPSGASTGTTPAQVALVITLRTAAKRGHAHAGRMFLPVPSRAIGTDGRLSTADRDLYVESMKDLYDNINAYDSAQHLAIMSKLGAGMTRRVTRVECGRVLDTMRSRRTKLSEEHAGQDLTTVP